MRIARFAKGDGVAYGVVDGETISELHGHPFGVDPGGVRLTGRSYPLAEVRLLAPVLPSKVIGAAASASSSRRAHHWSRPAGSAVAVRYSLSCSRGRSNQGIATPAGDL